MTFLPSFSSLLPYCLLYVNSSLFLFQPSFLLSLLSFFDILFIPHPLSLSFCASFPYSSFASCRPPYLPSFALFLSLQSSFLSIFFPVNLPSIKTLLFILSFLAPCQLSPFSFFKLFPFISKFPLLPSILAFRPFFNPSFFPFLNFLNSFNLFNFSNSSFFFLPSLSFLPSFFFIFFLSPFLSPFFSLLRYLFSFFLLFFLSSFLPFHLFFVLSFPFPFPFFLYFLPFLLA